MATRILLHLEFPRNHNLRIRIRSSQEAGSKSNPLFFVFWMVATRNHVLRIRIRTSRDAGFGSNSPKKFKNYQDSLETPASAGYRCSWSRSKKNYQRKIFFFVSIFIGTNLWLLKTKNRILIRIWMCLTSESGSPGDMQIVDLMLTHFHEAIDLVGKQTFNTLQHQTALFLQTCKSLWVLH